jgi:hypothetical protein
MTRFLAENDNLSRQLLESLRRDSKPANQKGQPNQATRAAYQTASQNHQPKPSTGKISFSLRLKLLLGQAQAASSKRYALGPSGPASPDRNRANGLSLKMAFGS